jgi:glyoxylase-like metal-dependent hydrolase (beta-lactamase superfamily II)
MDSAAIVRKNLASSELNPVAVLLTHGHFDHLGEAQVVADSYDIPVYVHPGDRHLLSAPETAMAPDMALWYAMAVPQGIVEPKHVEELADGQVLSLAGMEILVSSAPGHSPGSVLFQLTCDADTYCFTGDVLFAGSVGRTDLPGGDLETLKSSLRENILTIDDETGIYPGHGPDSTMARERVSNPYLHHRFLDR